MKKNAINLIKKLQNKGYIAYLAGGFVRDKLLGKQPDDFDIATSAKPGQIEKLFKKTISVGKKFGVIIVVEKGQQFEVATFRSDADYTDGRRPKAVRFTNAQEDSKRRDFTINGMFYDPVKREVIDYTGGQKDLKKKIIRFIGDPNERIKEDRLRLLRAIRFKNTLGFKYNPATWRAVKKQAKLIRSVSPERIKQELDKMWQSANRTNAFLDLDKSGILQQILPEVTKLKGVSQPYQIYRKLDVFAHTVLCLKKLPEEASSQLVWEIILHDIGKPKTKTRTDRIRFNGHAEKSYQMAKKILARLHFAKKEMDRILWVIKYHLVLYNYDKMKLATKRKWLLSPYFGDLLELSKADTEATPAIGKFKIYSKIKSDWKKALKKFPKIPKLISGKEVMKILNISEGPKVGKILAKVKEGQLAGKIKNKKAARGFIKKLKT